MMRTLDFWTTMAERHGQAIALENDETQVTYSELLVAVNALAVALQSKDPTPGTRVGLCARTSSLEYQVSMLAILAAGKVLVPLNCGSSTETLHEILNDTLCATVIVDEAGKEKIHADDDFTIQFSQFEGLVLTYRGQTPDRHNAQPDSATTTTTQEV
ncbi:AMP-binding protein [Alcaligenaceae bacterium]|nr:AMP-binding protein [Alcaligenaceae bacterium]